MKPLVCTCCSLQLQATRVVIEAAMTRVVAHPAGLEKDFLMLFLLEPEAPVL